MKTIVLLLLILGGCSKHEKLTAEYTCPMHPSVRSQDPNAKCPICSMPLVPVSAPIATPPQRASPPAHEHAGHAGSHAPSPPPQTSEISLFTVPVERRQMIGVTYTRVSRRPLVTSLRTIGLIEADAGLTWEYASRIDGYVQDLFVTSSGQHVKRGQPLLTIYSPDLLTTEQEFVDLLHSYDNTPSDPMRRSLERLIESAQRRLRLWNIGDQEIATLKQTRKASDILMLRSPFTGIAEQVSAKQGMNVKVGDSLIKILDLSTVWMWADFFENELPLLKVGRSIKVTAPILGDDEEFEGKIAVIDPTVNPIKRTIRVRIDIPNPHWTLRPGMYVNALLEGDAGVGLTIPITAVLPTGTRNLVFVKRGQGGLEPRFVQLGNKFTPAGTPYDAAYYEIRSGLKEGDEVVASANFLIDAESKIQGALKTWSAE